MQYSGLFTTTSAQPSGYTGCHHNVASPAVYQAQVCAANIILFLVSLCLHFGVCAKKSVFFSHPEHNVVLFLLYPDFAFRDGCRPYIEVYQGDEKVKSTLGDYERMRIYHVSEGKVRNSEISFPIVTASKRSTFCTESLVLISIQYVLGKRMVLTD